MISQEVLEHVPNPWAVVSEVCRVLKPGGCFFCQVPFIIGYHPGPHDFWRFSKEGIQRLFQSHDWTIRTLEISLGPGSGFYRIAVEYVAIIASVVHPKLYLPAKASAAVLLAPLKLADSVTHICPERDRIPGGYFCVAEKVLSNNADAAVRNDNMERPTPLL